VTVHGPVVGIGKEIEPLVVEVRSDSRRLPNARSVRHGVSERERRCSYSMTLDA
jgi:hypothetical protein